MPEPPGPGNRREPPCVHPDAGAYALGLLEPDERARYERHLRDCPGCARAVRSLAPLIELLSQVDPDSLLAATDPPAGRRPPHPVRVISPPRPAGGRSLSGRLLRASGRQSTAGSGGSRVGTPLRRLALAAAAVTVVSAVGFVTFTARSSVDAPLTAASQPPMSTMDPRSADRPAPVPPPASESPSPDATRAPAHRSATRTTEPSRAPTTAPPATAGDQPNTLDAGPAGSGALPAPHQYEARDARTGATATVDVTPAADGAAVTVTLSEVPGPRAGTVTVTTVRGATGRIATWRVPTGADTVEAHGQTTVDPDDIAQVTVHAEDGTVVVAVPTSS